MSRLGENIMMNHLVLSEIETLRQIATLSQLFHLKFFVCYNGPGELSDNVCIDIQDESLWQLIAVFIGESSEDHQDATSCIIVVIFYPTCISKLHNPVNNLQNTGCTCSDSRNHRSADFNQKKLLSRLNEY